MSAVKVTTGVAAHVPSTPTTPKKDMSGTVQRLARRLGVSPSTLAETIPADTLRRTKYPVVEQENEDGTTSYLPVKQVVTAPRSSAST